MKFKVAECTKESTSFFATAVIHVPLQKRQVFKKSITLPLSCTLFSAKNFHEKLFYQEGDKMQKKLLPVCKTVNTGVGQAENNKISLTLLSV